MEGAEEQRDHYKIPGKYKDSHIHRILGGRRKEGGRVQKSFWEEVMSILEIWRGKEDLGRESSLGGYLTVHKRKNSNGSDFWKVTVKASKALHTRLLVINVTHDERNKW